MDKSSEGGSELMRLAAQPIIEVFIRIARHEANRASFTADGWFTGRVKDLINRSDIKIYLPNSRI